MPAATVQLPYKQTEAVAAAVLEASWSEAVLDASWSEAAGLAHPGSVRTHQPSSQVAAEAKLSAAASVQPPGEHEPSSATASGS